MTVGVCFSADMLRTLALVLAVVAVTLAKQAAEESSPGNTVTEREGKLGGVLASSTNMIASMARQLVTQSYANSQVRWQPTRELLEFRNVVPF